MSKEADKLVDDLFDDVDDMDETLFDDDDEAEELEDEPVAPAGKDETKAFSERLKKEKEKMAKQLGYDSWEDALEKRTNSAMLDKGLDPETVKPLLKEMLKSDPDYVAAMEYKKDKEELEKKIWADNELKKLNDKYGLSLKSIDDLDDEVIKL